MRWVSGRWRICEEEDPLLFSEFGKDRDVRGG